MVDAGRAEHRGRHTDLLDVDAVGVAVVDVDLFLLCIDPLARRRRAVVAVPVVSRPELGSREDETWPARVG